MAVLINPGAYVGLEYEKPKGPVPEDIIQGPEGDNVSVGVPEGGGGEVPPNPRYLTSIIVTPANPSISDGGTQQFTATGVYNYGPNEDLTSLVVWTSMSPTVATIGSTTGLATGGSSTVYQYGFESGAGGWTHNAASGSDSWALSTVGPHSGTTNFLAVGPGSVSDQRLISPPVVLPASLSSVFLSFWHLPDLEMLDPVASLCSDGGILQVTTNAGASWTQVNNTYFSSGKYKGTISPAYGNPLGNLLGWSGETGYIHSIADISSYVSSSQTLQFRMRLGTDNSTGSLGWKVDDVLLQACRSFGTSVIKATLDPPEGQVQGQTVLTVTPILLSIAVTPSHPSVPAGENQQFTATGTYSDGTTADLTLSVTWASSDTDFVFVAADGLSIGVSVTATPITVTATLGAISGTALMDVTAAVVGGHVVGADTMHMWRLNEVGNLDTAIDDTAATPLGQVQLTTSVAGKIGRARRFTNTSSPGAGVWGYTSTADYTRMKQRGWTAGIWMRGLSSPGLLWRMIQQPPDGNHPWNRQLFSLSFNWGITGENLYISTAPSGGDYFDTESLGIFDNAWHHLVLVSPVSPSTLFKMYVDGVCYKNVWNDPYLNGGSGEPFPPSSAPRWLLGVGNDWGEAESMNDLEMDDFWVEKTAWTKSQVVAEYGMPVCLSITISPDMQSLGVGDTMQLTAMGTFSDASVRNITTKVHWFTIGPPTFVTIGKYTGLVSGVTPGPEMIKARLGTYDAETLWSNDITVNVGP